MVDDLVGLGKIAEVLRDVGLTLYQPTLQRKLADAEAYRILATRQAEAEGNELLDRARSRIEYREAIRQRNLESIARLAARELQMRELPAPALEGSQPHPDWTAAWSEAAQDVGDEDMQVLWARLLADEIGKPGTFSRRALATVKLMSKEDADLFTTFCSYVWVIDGSPIHVQPREGYEPDPDHQIEVGPAHDRFGRAGLSFEDQMHLVAVGLLAAAPQEISVAQLHLHPRERHTFSYHGDVFESAQDPYERAAELEVTPLTLVGQELVSVAGGESDPDYLRACLWTFRKSGLTVTKCATASTP